MPKRDASQLTPEERKRIVAGKGEALFCLKNLGNVGLEPIADGYVPIAAILLNIHEDTVRLVLREEGE